MLSYHLSVVNYYLNFFSFPSPVELNFIYMSSPRRNLEQKGWSRPANTLIVNMASPCWTYFPNIMLGSCSFFGLNSDWKLNSWDAYGVATIYRKLTRAARRHWLIYTGRGGQWLFLKQQIEGKTLFLEYIMVRGQHFYFWVFCGNILNARIICKETVFRLEIGGQ